MIGRLGMRLLLKLGAMLAAWVSLVPLAAGRQPNERPSMTVTEYVHQAGSYELVNTAYNQLPGTLISPHIQWARNPAWGKPRILILLPTWASRDAVELSQRFSADVSVVMVRSHVEWGAPAKGEPYGEVDPKEPDRRALMLLNRPEKYDSIIIGKIQWTAIPEAVRQLILDRVATGCGLVYISPRELDPRLAKLRAADRPKEDSPRITEGVPLGLLPLRNDERGTGPLAIATGQYGQGRVVLLDYNDNARIFDGGKAWRYAVGPETIALTPFVEDDPLFYDYYYSLLGKALLWTSRNEPEVRIVPRGETLEIDRARLPSSITLFDVIAKDRAAGCTAYLELRDRQGGVLMGREVPLGEAGDRAEAAVEIPCLPAGLTMADLWLMKDRRVLNWASIGVKIVAPEIIDAVIPEKELFQRGEPIRGIVRLKTDLPDGASLRVELIDPNQRIIDRAQWTVSGREAPFTLKLTHPLARVYAISATVVDGRGTLQQRTIRVGVPDNCIDDFLSLMWGVAISNRTQSILRQQCKRHGVDGYYDGVLFLSEPTVRACAMNLAWDGLMAQPYVQHINVGTHWTVLADYLRNCADPLRAKAAAYAPYGTIGYSICEENYIEKTDKQWARPLAMAEYRDWALKRFGSLDKANRVWGTSFQKWEDVGLLTLTEAKQRDCFPLWVTQQQYRQDFFMRVHEASAVRLREADPGARVTLDCIEGYDFDWPRAAEFCQGGWAGYNLVPLVMHRPGAVYGEGIGWNPGQLDPFRMRFFPWKALLDGGQIVFWWPIGFHRGLGGAAAFTPDASEPLLCFSQMCEEVRQIHHGVGALLVQSRKVRDPIVVNHSTASYYASVLNRKEITWEDSHKMFHQALGKIGWTARDLAPREMENLRYGEDARVLILPYSQSMTEKEIASVKRFTEDGGFVVADFRPALFDEHCCPYGKPEVVSQGTEDVCPKCGGKMRYEEATASVTRWIACPMCSGTGKIVAGREVRYTLSKLQSLLGGFEPMRLETHGKGKSLYLGKTLGKPSDREGLAGLIEKHTPLRRHFLVLDTYGNPRTDVVTASFVNGDSQFFCFLPERLVADPPGPETIVRLPQPRHVYDVCRQNYLGYTAEFKTGAVPAVPKVFAALPCKLESLSIRLQRKTFLRGAEVKVVASLTPARIAGSGLCARFEVIGPQGKRLDYYTRKVVSTSGAFELTIPLALNEAAGDYSVAAGEIASGLRATATFSVSEP